MHEKLCRTFNVNANPERFYICICGPLAEARADEREKAAQRIYTAMNNVTHTDVIREPWLVVEKAVAAARGGEQE